MLKHNLHGSKPERLKPPCKDCFHYSAGRAAVAVVTAGPIFAAGKGQEDFDKATELKLSASTISDLGEVIRLTESALKKGLDETTAAFAKNVLASTLIQRAQMTSRYGLQGVATLKQVRQRRQFALSDLEKAVKLDPKQPEAFLMIAELNCRRRERPASKRSRAALDKAIELSGDDPALRAKALVLRADLQEKPEKRLADLNQAIALAPDDVETLLSRADAYREMGEKQKALADADHALKLQPGWPRAVRTRALLLAEDDRLDEAVGELEQLAKREPKDVADPAAIGLVLQRPEELGQGDRNLHGRAGHRPAGLAGPPRTRQRLPERRQAGRGRRRLREGDQTQPRRTKAC